MKKLIVATLVGIAAGLSAPGMAADSHAGHGSHAAPPTPAAAEAPLTDGLVKKIDKAAGRVTLAHGPLNGMPGMTMMFRVKEAAWLGQMKEGQKIRFAAEDTESGMMVVRFVPVK